MPRFDRRRFLLAWLRAPLRIASITPSGPRLAGLMTKEISALTGPVLELGPGTGVFTAALLKRGIAERDLTLVEYEQDFATLLLVGILLLAAVGFVFWWMWRRESGRP